MATIQDMAQTAASIRDSFEGITRSLGESVDTHKMMGAVADMYINICRLEADLQEAATPSSENTPGGAAEKMPGGGSGNFDREGGLETSDGDAEQPFHTRLEHLNETFWTAGGTEFSVSLQDTTFLGEIEIPVKLRFIQTMGDADKDVDISAWVDWHDYKIGSTAGLDDPAAAEWVRNRIFRKADGIREHEQFIRMRELWKHRVAAYRRGWDTAKAAA